MPFLFSLKVEYSTIFTTNCTKNYFGVCELIPVVGWFSSTCNTKQFQHHRDVWDNNQRLETDVDWLEWHF